LAGAHRGILAVLAAAVVGLASPAAAGVDLTLSVAISLKEVVEALGRSFAASHPAVMLRYNLGASGVLQRQIEAGAPVDVYVAAAAHPVDALVRRGLLLGDSRRAVARNVLVAVTPGAGGLPLGQARDLADDRVGRVAVGNPRTVPAGEYARAALRREGLWERLGPRLVFAENVRQVLEYVGRGEAEAGLVYGTDAAAAGRRVRVAFALREETYPPVLYVAAVVAGSRQPALARDFVELLAGPDGQALFRRHGFLPAPGDAR
jgi:molybdate transport system substrate-binding protein